MKNDVDAFLLESGMEKTRRYLSEGRHFESLSGADLRSEWMKAFRGMAANPGDPASRKRHDDLQAELEIRKIPPPYDEVRNEFDAFIAQTTEAMERVKNDPVRWAEANEEIHADIDALKAKRNNSAKN
jgi:hypothetical protein